MPKALRRGPGVACARRSTGAGDKPGSLRYEAEHRNVYHNLANFWVRESATRGSLPVAANLDEFQLEMLVNRSDTSVALAVKARLAQQLLQFLRQRPQASAHSYPIRSVC